VNIVTCVNMMTCMKVSSLDVSWAICDDLEMH
jgi:hypothetical protein